MRFTIYGKDNCSFCKRAVNLCKRKSYKFTYIRLVERDSGQQDEITKEALEGVLKNSFQTVPQVVLHESGGDRLIGGYDELNEFVRGL